MDYYKESQKRVLSNVELAEWLRSIEDRISQLPDLGDSQSRTTSAGSKKKK